MKSSLFFVFTVLLLFYGNIVHSQLIVLEENFSSVLGSGGNDSNWSGSVAGSPITTFDSWTIVKGFKGYECLKIGTTTQRGELFTPILSELSGDAILTFRAGAWNAVNEKIVLQLDIIGGGDLSVSEVSLTKGVFSSYSVAIIGGTPSSQIVFKGEASNNSRFFIDSIKIVSDEVTSVPDIITTEILGVYGDLMNEVITVSNSPSSFNVVGTMPAGISFSMGSFSGIPLETGIFSVTVIATNNVGNSIATEIDIVIDKASQFLMNADDVILDINQVSYSLFEKSTANLDVFYTVLDTTVAVINDNVLQVEGVGVTQIIATQQGNEFYKALNESLLLVVLEDTPDCGVEDFTNILIPSSYHDGAFIGNNNIVWNYIECRNENLDTNESGIAGSAIMLRRAADNSKIYSNIIPTGIGSFSVKLYKGFTGAGNRQVELFINGESKGVSDPFDDYEEHLFVVDSINIEGNVEIELRNIKSMQIIIDDIGFTCYESNVGETIWDGFSWSNGVPTNEMRALVKGDFQSLGDLDMHSLIIDSNFEFTLSSGDELKVGDIINNGVFSIKNGANILQEEGALNTGNVQVDIETTPLKRLDYMVLGTPVNGQNLYSFSEETLHNRFYEFDSYSNSFINGGIDSLSSFEVGRAYGIRTPNTFTNTPQKFNGVYRGALNNDVVEVPVSASGEGFNLIGNPYPSLIDLDMFFEENIHVDASAYFYINANDFDEVTGMYVGNNYAVYNKLGTVSADNSSFVPASKLGIANGFIVKSNSDVDVIFSNGIRVSRMDISSFNNNDSVVLDRYWLELEGTSVSFSSQILLGYIEGATNDVDRLYDASQLQQNASSLSTLNQGEYYVIQGRSYPFNEDDIVRLSLKIIKAGYYSINLKRTEGIFENDQEVYLRDKFLDEIANISRNAYDFYSEVGDFDDRFEIVYKNSSLSVNEFLKEDDGVSIYVKEKLLEIGVKNGELSRVELLDIKGKVIFDSGKLNQDVYELNCDVYARGVYLVRIELKDVGVKIRKIIL